MALQLRDNRNYNYNRWVVQQGARLAANYAYRVAPEVAQYVKRQASAWYSQPARKRQKVTSAMARTTLVGGGVYAGRFRKQKRKIPRTPKGISTRIQTGGEIAAATIAESSVLFGSTPHIPQQTLVYWWLAILKYLARMADQDFTSEYELIGEDTPLQPLTLGAEITYTITVGSEPDLLVRTVNIIPGQTWRDLATVCASDTVAFLTGNAVVHWKKCVLTSMTMGSGASGSKNHVMKLDDTYVDLSIRENLKIQNRTGANADTEKFAENIESNPLNGRIYVVTKPYLDMRYSQPGAVTPNWRPSTTTGMMVVDLSDTSYSTGLKDILGKIPSPSLFSNIKSSAVVKLQPGHIKANSISYNIKGKFDKVFQQMFYDYASGALNNARAAPMQVYALEKTMQTNTGTAVVRIGYEKMTYFNCSMTVRKSKGFIPITREV